MLDTKYLKKQSITYIFISILCLIIGIIYEMFSHNVYSFYMTYAFLIPLIFGFFPSIIMVIKKNNQNRKFINLYNASISTFTIYSFIRGFLEIYGTTNSLINIYIITGIILLVLSIYFKGSLSNSVGRR